MRSCQDDLAKNVWGPRRGRHHHGHGVRTEVGAASYGASLCLCAFESPARGSRSVGGLT